MSCEEEQKVADRDAGGFEFGQQFSPCCEECGREIKEGSAVFSSSVTKKDEHSTIHICKDCWVREDVKKHVQLWVVGRASEIVDPRIVDRNARLEERQSKAIQELIFTEEGECRHCDGVHHRHFPTCSAVIVMASCGLYPGKVIDPATGRELS